MTMETIRDCIYRGLLVFGLLMVLIGGLCLLSGCESKEEQRDLLTEQILAMRKELRVERDEKAELQEEIAALQSERDLLEGLRDEKTFAIVFSIRQSTFTLDIGEHAKNAMNKIELMLPVSAVFFESVNVGDEISSDFKWGSLLFNGDFSKLKVTVKEKKIL